MRTNNVLITNKASNPSFRKRFFVLIAAIVLALTIILIVVLVKNSEPKYENTGGEYEISFEKNDGFTEILNIYYNLPNSAPEEYFNEILSKGEVAKDYIHINDKGGESYISPTMLEAGVDHSNQNIEYISFDYIPAYDEVTVPVIDNITYHSFHDGKHDYIFESSDGTFTHVSGDLSNTYGSKLFAIDSYLMTL